MVEVNVRELKSRLSYYLKLMQAGENIAIKIRSRLVGFLSSQRPDEDGPPFFKKGRKSLAEAKKVFQKLVKAGLISSTTPFKYTPCTKITPVKLSPGSPPLSDLIREMRDEE